MGVVRKLRDEAKHTVHRMFVTKHFCNGVHAPVNTHGERLYSHVLHVVWMFKTRGDTANLLDLCVIVP